MSRFLETIQLKDGEFKLLERHQARMNCALNDFFSGGNSIALMDSLLKTDYPKVGLYKCRVLYDAKIELIEYIAYQKPRIDSLKVIEIDLPSYRYKQSERTALQNAYSLRGDCDDVLLVRNDLLTDTSYCNIALYDGSKWSTPRLPLLYGVQRAQLLSEGKLVEKDIALNELRNYSTLCLFNAMNEFGTILLSVGAIVGDE